MALYTVSGHSSIPAALLDFSRRWSARQIRGYRFATSSTDQSKDGWETVIGLEVHAQIRTDRKLFSAAPLSYAESPNTQTVAFDAALPGTLPVLNEDAIRLAISTALALGCKVNTRSTFDRKHYFYHDIPASYQITQHYNPLARYGKLKIGDGGTGRVVEVGIQQLQVEQDTAKSQVVGDKRLVDLNRAGTGLMEIVTDPDMRSSEEAGMFVRRLQGLLRRLGSGDGDMEKGNLRIDANVSVRRPGEAFGTRCEIKNLNSVRFLQQGIESERRRHIAHYESGTGPLQRETRGLNEITGETFSLRSKEDAEDYRYMPDSNLPAMVINSEYLARVKDELPELPWVMVDRVAERYGVPRKDVEIILALDEYGAKGLEYYEEVVGDNADIGKRALNLIANDFIGFLNRKSISWSEDIIPPILMREIAETVERGKINTNTARTVIQHIIDDPSFSRQALPAILQTLGLTASNPDDLLAICQKAIDSNPNAARDVRKGVDKALAALIGNVMRQTKGQADGKRAKEILLELLK